MPTEETMKVVRNVLLVILIPFTLVAIPYMAWDYYDDLRMSGEKYKPLEKELKEKVRIR